VLVGWEVRLSHFLFEVLIVERVGELGVKLIFEVSILDGYFNEVEVNVEGVAQSG